MFKMAAITLFFLLFSTFCLLEVTVHASECCEAYYDRYGVRQKEEWCSEYCCNTFSIFKSNELECCSNSLRRTDYTRRSSTCSAWWSDHAWVPVLISIGCIAAITLCCFGCFKLCSNNNNRTGMMIQQPQAPAVVMVAGHHQGQPQYPSSVQNQAMYPPVSQVPPPYDAGMRPNPS